MAAVALQRELDAYSDAINTYNRQARGYKSAATKHNESIDAYNTSLVPDNKGKPGVFTLSPDGGYYGVNDARGVLITPQNVKNYIKVDLGNNFFGLQRKDNAPSKPGEFTREQPTSPGPAPSATAAQIKRLDAPSLTDIERTGGSGLISSAFNY